MWRFWGVASAAEVFNLTGRKVHFCRKYDRNKHQVWMTLEPDAQQPAVTEITADPDVTVHVRYDDNEWELPVYTTDVPHTTTTIVNLRKESWGVIFIVDEQILEIAARLAAFKDRRDLCCPVTVPYKRVQDGVKEDIYCIGVRVIGSKKVKESSYDYDDDDDDDD